MTAATVAERRRVAGVLLSFAGATVGGLLPAKAHIYAPVFPFVITLAAVDRFAGARRGRVGTPLGGLT
jgi:hypothetical protein